MKTSADRLADTKEYLKQHITLAQYTEVLDRINLEPNLDALSDVTSIGHSNPFGSTSRRAKRCLMLLAQLFIKDQGHRTAELTRLKNLPEKSETPLIAEIKSWFTVPGVGPGEVAQHAKNNIEKMPKWDNQNIDVTQAVRGVYQVKAFNCYNGCVFWAFQAGAISKRYLWNYLYGTDGNAFFPIYSAVGWDTIINRKDGADLDVYHGGPINPPAGRTVYFETPYKKFGHVACSLGDGSVISQNSVNVGNDTFSTITDPLVKAEFEKMAHAVTHIVSIRDMIKYYFNPEHGYPTVKVTSGVFWDPIEAADR